MSEINSTTPLKCCTKCKQSFPETSEYFAPGKGYKNGLKSICRACLRAERIARSTRPIPVGTTRKCKGCERVLPLTDEYWHKDKMSTYGFAYSCKECAKANSRKWVADNPERNKANCNNRYATKKEAYIEYRHVHADEIVALKRDWRKRNPDKVKKHKSESQKRHRDSASARSRKSAKRHPERVRASTLTRIARKKGAPGKYTGEDIQRMYEEQNGLCSYCGIRIYLDIPRDVHVDHIVPITKGGSNWPDNLNLCCQQCNSSKGNLLLPDWLAVRGW